ncbi:hypothetical protein A5906_19410 [Bradyrhizobium sacchari]|nr:hypothetical protein A5906_19410 [Bradyrhizobium sacchari]
MVLASCIGPQRGSQADYASIVLVALERSDDLRKIELRKNIRVDPEMEHASNIGMPIEKRKFTLYLE